MPHTHGLEAGLRELSGHLGVRLQNRDFIGQTLDDPGIRVRGSQQALPGLDLQIAKSRRLRKTWSLGQRGQALAGCHAQCLDLALLHKRLSQRNRQHGKVDLTTCQLGQHLRTRPVGNMYQIDTGHLLNQLPRQVQAGSDAIGAQGQSPRFLARKFNEVVRTARSESRAGEQHKDRRGYRCHGLQLLQTVVAELGRRDQGGNQHRAGHTEEQGIAIGPGLDDTLRCNSPRCSDHVFYDHGLAQALCQARHRQPGGDIYTTARCEGNHHRQCLDRPGLGSRLACQ